MNAVMLGLLAETAIHPGIGRSIGTVDLPVAREAATDFPVIFGSGVKGAMRDKACQEWGGFDPEDKKCKKNKEVNTWFGEQEEAGKLIISDARLILLPVRCLSGQYRWLTCPCLLERFKRDSARMGRAVSFSIPTTSKGKALGQGTGLLYLEERQFEIFGPVANEIPGALIALLAHDDTAARLAEQLVILHNDDFAWFARYGLPVNARNILSEKKTSENLWYEETLPPDSLFYCTVAARSGTSNEAMDKLFNAKPYIQMGGNETVGQGWFAVKKVA